MINVAASPDQHISRPRKYAVRHHAHEPECKRFRRILNRRGHERDKGADLLKD